jgi:hypothetical protein
MDFAQIINTPKLGQVVLVEESGDVSPRSTGYLDIYIASNEGICKMQVSRADLTLSKLFIDAAEDPVKLQDLIQSMHRASGSDLPERIAQAIAGLRIEAPAIELRPQFTVPEAKAPTVNLPPMQPNITVQPAQVHVLPAPEAPPAPEPWKRIRVTFDTVAGVISGASIEREN